MELTHENVRSMQIGEFLGRQFSCGCGKTHFMDMDSVIVAKGAISGIVETVRRYGARAPLVIADENTYAAAGRQVAELLFEAGIAHRVHVFPGAPALVPDERTAGALLFAIGEETDLLLAVGTGVINDIVKYVSRRTGLPEVLVPTAPSMDGFVSDTSAPTVGNLKSSFPCNLPRTILADIDVLQQAPERMILAGFADIVGKYSALTDWKLGRIVNGEYYCPRTAQITEDVLDACAAEPEGLRARSETAVRHVTEGLVRTGIAMSYVNNSRPASGSEHHLSHYLEMQYLFQGKEALLHGTKVGITSILVAKMYEALAREEDVDFDAAVRRARAFDEAAWEKMVRRYYGPAAAGIIRAAASDGRNDAEARVARIESVRCRWEEIRTLAAEAKDAAFLEDLFRRAGAPLRPKEVGIPNALVHDAVLIGREVRTRYTILRLLEDLGLTEKYTDIIDAFLAEGSGAS